MLDNLRSNEYYCILNNNKYTDEYYDKSYKKTIFKGKDNITEKIIPSIYKVINTINKEFLILIVNEKTGYIRKMYVCKNNIIREIYSIKELELL